MENKCIILVPSCDAYADLWPTFLHGVKKYWSDCPFELYLGANELRCEEDGVRGIGSNEGLVWSSRLRDFLGQVECTHVLLMLEDFILRKPVATAEIMDALTVCTENQLDCLRLVPRPAPCNRPDGKEKYGRIEPGEIYRFSTQAAIWRKEFLLQILQPGLSIWQFELGAKDPEFEVGAKVWGVYTPLLPYEGIFTHHVVEKGKWLPHELWILRRKRFPITEGGRPTIGIWELAAYQAGEYFTRLTQQLFGRNATKWRNRSKKMVPRFVLNQYDKLRGRAGNVAKAPPSQ